MIRNSSTMGQMFSTGNGTRDPEDGEPKHKRHKHSNSEQEKEINQTSALQPSNEVYTGPPADVSRLSTFAVALKAPKGRKAIHFDSVIENDVWHHDIDIDGWVNQRLQSSSWRGHILYNDEEPAGGEAHSSGGHCKGIVVWNEDKLGWLVHSVPKWPCALGDPIPHSELEYGQSFIWVLLPADRLPNVVSRLQLMQAHVYRAVEYAYSPHHKTPTTKYDVWDLFPGAQHVAKHAHWGRDLYEDGLADLMGGGCDTETWSRPGQPPSARAGRVAAVRWGDGTAYDEERDHSKWAVSRDAASRPSASRSVTSPSLRRSGPLASA